ncbi:hypothetical protein CYMTET_56299 [Cymbomonas tetramitiformis]|uniref:Transmembrane protein n=1 Tax=Cymbomonas tetramitiformis TaxID=36881 RepID=A0AAE0BB89_9CHLO|nr:hypothetical protein CYMTET_56299 [Cymbomonas tetramitiformis]
MTTKRGRQSSLYQDPYPTVGAAQVVQVGANTLVTMMALVERKEQVAWMTLYVLASSTMVNGGIPTAITASDTTTTLLAAIMGGVAWVTQSAIPWSIVMLVTQQHITSHIIVAALNMLVMEAARQMSQRPGDLCPSLQEGATCGHDQRAAHDLLTIQQWVRECYAAHVKAGTATASAHREYTDLARDDVETSTLNINTFTANMPVVSQPAKHSPAASVDSEEE